MDKTQQVSSSSRRENLYTSSGVAAFPELIQEVEKKRAAKQIISFVVNDDFIEGEITKTQLYLEKLRLKNKYLFIEAFTSAWVDLYGADNEKHLYTLISICSCLPYEWLNQHGDALILGCCSHSSTMVNEACIRLAESWEEPKHAEQLEKMKPFDCKWLENYRLETIDYLKELD